MPIVAFVGGTVLVALLRSRPGPSFAAAVCAWVIASPALYVNTLAVLLSMVAPLAWPWRAEAARVGPSAMSQ